MGYRPGPTPHRLPADRDRPGSLVGHLPMVLTNDVHSGRRAKLDELVGKICIALVFVMWVVVPVCGGLSLILK